MHKKTSLAAVLAAAALLVACGGDGGTGPGNKTVVAVTPGTISKPAGYTTQFTATVNGAAATAGQVTWSSSNTAIATVSGSGIATAVAPGTATIRATSGAAFGEGTLTVVANTAPTVSAGADLDATRGSRVTLNATGTDPEGESLTYAWTQISGPNMISGETPVVAHMDVFAPPIVTVAQFTVVASDGLLSSAPDTVRVYVLEDPAKAIWVAPNGAVGNSGTRQSPLASVDQAVGLAKQTGADVYVAYGTYSRVSLATGVDMYGGFTADWSVRDLQGGPDRRSIIRDAGTALRGNNVQDVTVDGFGLETSDAVAGGSTYTVTLEGSQSITLIRNMISSGAGGAGLSGATGAPGAPGQRGANSPGEITPGAGGNNGGSGGRGGDMSTPASAGFAGSFGAGGSSGAAAQPPTPGGNGGRGPNGANGAMGGGGASSGSYTALGEYLPARGANGSSGVIGLGGGGGGGGGGVFFFPVFYNGGGGGGGGGGGAGGAGGTAGEGGGGSFAIRLISSTGITLTSNVIAPGPGGRGGVGGMGGAGGVGGVGGIGFDPSASRDGREGGNGGPGGDGGRGGQGGGGGGGVSVGVFIIGGSTFTDTDNTYFLGTGGAGGAPNGWAGISRALIEIP